MSGNTDQSLGDSWYYSILRQNEHHYKAAQLIKEVYPDWKSPDEIAAEARKEREK